MPAWPTPLWVQARSPVSPLCPSVPSTVPDTLDALTDRLPDERTQIKYPLTINPLQRMENFISGNCIEVIGSEIKSLKCLLDTHEGVTFLAHFITSDTSLTSHQECEFAPQVFIETHPHAQDCSSAQRGQQAKGDIIEWRGPSLSSRTSLLLRRGRFRGRFAEPV